MSDLLKQIDDLVASKTFSLDALDAIKNIKDELKRNHKEAEALRAQLEESSKVRTVYIENISILDRKVESLTKQLDASRAAADAGVKASYESEKDKAVAEAYKDILHTIFRPSATRESIQRTVAVPVAPGPNNAGCVTTSPESELITTEQI